MRLRKMEYQIPKRIEKYHSIFSSIEKLEQNNNSHKLYTDQNFQLTIRSNRGYNYLMVFYIYDINEIWTDL